jgi:hypothetical protein
MPVKYELIDKVTGVSVFGFLSESDVNNDTQTVTCEDGSMVVFSNPEGNGQLFNEQYVIRQADSHVEPDGEGIVADVVPTV